MKKELDEKLCQDFPILYQNRYGERSQTNMCWGFECGDGWEMLIRELSKGLEELNTGKLLQDNQGPIVATQVKEKFGGLRFYTNFVTEEANELISKAEQSSYNTCEECGGPGELRRETGWLYTSCHLHKKQ